MTYAPPPHLSIVRVGKLANDRECAFWCEAVRKQLQDHVAPAWGMPAPGVFIYSDDQFTPASEGAVIAIVDDDGNDDAAGLHSKLGNVAYGLVDLHQAAVPSRTLSHEALELWANAALDRWVPRANGLDYALELCDAVQRDEYTIPITIFAEKREVVVSNFVRPEWFGLPRLDGRAGLDMLGTVKDGPFALAPGGYAIAKNDRGAIVYLSHADGSFMEPRKISKWSRTRRLIEQGT